MEPKNEEDEPELLTAKEVRTIAQMLMRQEATKVRGIKVTGAQIKDERVEKMIEQIHKDLKGVVFF